MISKWWWCAAWMMCCWTTGQYAEFEVERGCYDEWCAVAFETEAYAAFIVEATLDVVISGGEFLSPTQFVDVVIEGDATRCGDAFERCGEELACVDDRDVSSLARTGALTISLIASDDVVPGTCGGTYDLFHVEAVLRVTISTTVLPTVSPAPSPQPTTTLAPTTFIPSEGSRIFIQESACFDDEWNCRDTMGLTFDTSNYAAFIASADLTIRLDGDFGDFFGFREIRIFINSDEPGDAVRCSSFFGESCRFFPCSNFMAIDVTPQTRSGSLAISFDHTYNLERICGTGDLDDRYSWKAMAILVVDLHNESIPSSSSSKKSKNRSSLSHGGRIAVIVCAAVIVLAAIVATIFISTKKIPPRTPASAPAAVSSSGPIVVLK